MVAILRCLTCLLAVRAFEHLCSHISMMQMPTFPHTRTRRDSFAIEIDDLKMLSSIACSASTLTTGWDTSAAIVPLLMRNFSSSLKAAYEEPWRLGTCTARHGWTGQSCCTHTEPRSVLATPPSNASISRAGGGSAGSTHSQAMHTGRVEALSQRYYHRYEADHHYALPKVAFFMLAIILFATAYVASQFLPRQVLHSKAIRQVIALKRYLSYRNFRIPGLDWNSAPVGVLMLAALGVLYFVLCGPLSMQSDVANGAARVQLDVVKSGSKDIYLHMEHYSWA